MIELSQPFAVSVNAAAQAPPWWTALQDLTVTRRGNNFATATMPSGVAATDFIDIMKSWNGGDYDEFRQRFYIVLPSGHGNYHDRGTIYYDILAELWARLTPRYTTSVSGDGTQGVDVNGDPIDTHTYNIPTCSPDGRIWVPGMGSVAVSSGVTSARGWVQDPTGLSETSPRPYGWTDLGLNTLSGSNVGASDYDRVTQRIWYCHKDFSGGTVPVASWTMARVRTEYTVAGTSSFGSSGDDSCLVCFDDGAGNSWLMMKGDARVRTLNLQTAVSGGANTWQAPTWTGAVQPTGKCKLNWNPQTNQLWQWRQFFNQLIVCNVPANRATGTYDWFLVNLGGLTITPPVVGINGPGTTNGTFKRAPQIRMTDGRYGGMVINGIDEQVHFFKQPTAPMVAG